MRRSIKGKGAGTSRSQEIVGRPTPQTQGHCSTTSDVLEVPLGLDSLEPEEIAILRGIPDGLALGHYIGSAIYAIASEVDEAHLLAEWNRKHYPRTAFFIDTIAITEAFRRMRISGDDGAGLFFPITGQVIPL
jgi:hypothetical protein